MKSSIIIHDIEGAVDELNKISASLKGKEVRPESLNKIVTSTKLHSTMQSNGFQFELDLSRHKEVLNLSPDGLLLAVQIASEFNGLISLDLSFADTGDNILSIMGELNQYSPNFISLNISGIQHNNNLLNIIKMLPYGIQILDLSDMGALTSDIAVAISNTRVRQLNISENTILDSEPVNEVWSNLVLGGVASIVARKFGSHNATIDQLKAIVNAHNADISIWKNHIQPIASQYLGQLGEIRDLVDIIGDYVGVEISVEG